VGIALQASAQSDQVPGLLVGLHDQMDTELSAYGQHKPERAIQVREVGYKSRLTSTVWRVRADKRVGN